MVINIEEGVRRVVNNKKLYFRLLKNFKGRQMAEKITEAVQIKDYKEAASACHALKGTAANLAMRPLTDIVTKIEECVAAGQDPEGFFPELMENIEAVETAVSELAE